MPNKALVSSNGSQTALDKLKKGVYRTRIYPRQPSSNSTSINSSTVAFDASTYDGIRIGIWSASPGTDANLLTLTDQTGWTYNVDDADNPYFEGDLITNTDQITTWLAGATCDDAFLSIALVRGADITPIYDFAVCGTENIEIQNQTDPGSGNSINMTGLVPKIPVPCQFVLGTPPNEIIFSVTIIPGSPPVFDITQI